MRRVCNTDRAKALNCACTECAIKFLATEHLARGGTLDHLDHELSLKRVQSLGLELNSKQQTKITKRRNRNCFQMWWSHVVCEEWRDSDSQDDFRDPSTANMPNCKRRLVDHFGKSRPHKGCADWSAWESYKEKRLEEWRSDGALRLAWVRRAAEFAEMNPMARVEILDIPTEPLTEDLSYWSCGCSKHPILLEHVERVISSYTPKTAESHPMSQRSHGGVIAGINIKQEDITNQVFMQADSKLPSKKLPPLDIKLQCFDEHPGVCKSRDARVYRPTLCVAQNANAIFSKLSLWSAVGRCFRLIACDRDAQPISTMEVFVLHIRKARPVVQVFCPLQADANGERFKLRTTSDGRRLLAQTSYTCFAEFLARVVPPNVPQFNNGGAFAAFRKSDLDNKLHCLT